MALNLIMFLFIMLAVALGVVLAGFLEATIWADYPTKEYYVS